MHVRLTAKLAEVVNGIDLKPYAEGDIIESFTTQMVSRAASS